MKRLIAVLVSAVVIAGGAFPAFAAAPSASFDGSVRVNSICARPSHDRMRSCMQSVCDRFMLAMQKAAATESMQPSAEPLKDVSAYAQPNGAQGACGYYVDANGDGICDNHGMNCSNGAQGACGSYVDADGDGVCDNHEANCPSGASSASGTQGSGNGSGSSSGTGAHHGSANSYGNSHHGSHRSS